MERQAAIEEIRGRWREFYPAAKVRGQMICPLCGHGTHGDGIRENPKSKNKYSLKCFGTCGFSGDIFDLVQKERGYDFNQALQAAADQLGIVIDNDNAGDGPQRARKPAGDQVPANEEKAPESAPESVSDYTAYYETCAKRIEDPEAAAYLDKRGISQDTAFLYGLGYDPAWISPAAKKKLAEEGREWRPAPTKRIIIPVSRNHYIARAMDPAVKEYTKVNETGGGRSGIFNEKALISDARAVFITEGVFDALSVIEAGAAAVALNSTSMINRFLEELRARPTKAVLVICLDTDDAGKKAADQLRQGLDILGILYVTADISGGYKDPNEALTGDRPAFIERVKAAEKKAKALQPDFMEQFLNKIQSEKYRPYETGLPFFDDLFCGGLVRGTLTILLAAPGAGKTALCAQIGEAIAERRRPVLYLNLEMTADQMFARAISGRVFAKGVKASALDVMQGYRWTEEQRAAILSAIDEYRETVAPYMHYNGLNHNTERLGADLPSIKAYLAKVGAGARAAGREAPAVILDYLHLVTSDSDVPETVKQTIFALKEYAAAYDTIAIAISATNRESYSNGKITISSGRDSSGIEYTGDYILGLNYFECELPPYVTDEDGKRRPNPKYVSPDDPRAMAQLLNKDVRPMILRVLKGRFIAPGRDATLKFYAPGARFYGEHDFLPVEPEQDPFRYRKAPAKKKTRL